MEEKKIATSVDIIINLGNYEHIQITKYAEKKIAYTNAEDMVKQEDQLTQELTSDIIRTMRALPSKLGKTTTANIAVEEKIAKKIPEWLLDNVEPNIANNALIQHDKNKAKAVEDKAESKPTGNIFGSENKESASQSTEENFDADGEDLFK